MATTAGIDAAGARGVAGRVPEGVLQPGDDGYDEARRVHNGLVDRRPAVIARCQNTADTAAGVRFARAQSLQSASVAAATTSPDGRSWTER